MSITAKSITTSVFLPTLDVKPSRRFQVRISLISSSNYATFDHSDHSVCWDKTRSTRKNEKSRRRFHVCNVVEGGAPPPSEPPFNFISWILGVAITVVLPFFSGKWASLLKLKNEVETAVETVEEIVEAVEKVAEGVEKVAEDIADDLPEGGRLRKAVDFIESVAERASNDAHLVGDFIDKVQEVEERVEEYVESLAEESTTHEYDHPQEEQEKGHDHDPPNQENTHKLH
ncbi:UNVERIFIED_CONTAM: hypothetical protein Slati_2300400 [Sesamum latifolium]|uniref:Uncharacterized protein n=1 Tax=Sesamum latifolium TaxID=2727402 RepID=A0AAW2W8K5_9LAMI